MGSRCHKIVYARHAFHVKWIRAAKGKEQASSGRIQTNDDEVHSTTSTYYHMQFTAPMHI